MAAVALAGVAVLLYPMAGNWFEDRRHAHTISGYARAVADMPPEQVARELAAAHAYNRSLPKGQLQDPYSANPGQGSTAAAVAKYADLLDDGPRGMMGMITIPSIDVKLPIFHGTGSASLDLGSGHLFGSALPVGGPGTHAVLTAHSGVVGKELFSNLHEVTPGQKFYVTVLNQTLAYRFDQIKIVKPDQVSNLGSVTGKDYLTLLTCTPIGVNSHRLLVRGVRIPGTAADADQVLRGVGRAGFPWWILYALSAFVAVVAATSLLADKRRDLASPEADSQAIP